MTALFVNQGFGEVSTCLFPQGLRLGLSGGARAIAK